MSWRSVGCVGLVAVVALGAAVGGLGWATFGNNAKIEDQRVLPGGAVVLQDGYVSVFLVPLHEAGQPLGTYALVDAGNDPSGAAIDQALTARGAVRDDVRAVLLTHGHPDHVAACHGFEQATIYVLRDELPLLRGEVAARGPLPRLFGASESPCPTERTVGVEDGAAVPLGGDVVARVLALPGHTAGSGAWWIDGVLYLGDAADGDTDGALHPAKWVFSDDRALATRSLVQLADRLGAEGLAVSALAFSHTGVVDGAEPLLAFARSRRPPSADDARER